MYWLGYLGYQTGLALYGALVHIAALFNHKAKLFVEGRRGLLSVMADRLKNESRSRIWFHCASLGEFEQARPLIEQFKKEYPGYAVIITFFSPSGYEVRKNYALADYVFYLPLDSERNAKKFVTIVKPALVFFVKYEVWFHYLRMLKKATVPVFLISANFRVNHIYFKWYGDFFRRMLQSFNHIFCQNNLSYDRLLSIGISETSVSRDTRFDRVFEHARFAPGLPLIEQFTAGKKVMVAGSSYAAEEQLIATGMREMKDWKIIIAPHHIEPVRIREIENCFEGYGVIRFSALDPAYSNGDKQVLIIDNIGMLSSIYQYASVAFIGGGFGKTGLHNTLEAVAFGIPVLFGPNNLEKFPESLDMIAAGVGFMVSSEKDFEKKMIEWNNQPEALQSAGVAAKAFVAGQVGATRHIFQHLQPLLEGNK